MDPSIQRPSLSLSAAQQALLNKIGQDNALGQRPATPADHTGDKVGLTMSIAAHLLLVLFFVIGLAWKTEEPAPFEAILFAELPGPSAQPAPTPEPQPEPEPVAKPEPAKQPEPAPEPPKADIKLPKPEPKKPEPKKPEPKKPEPKPEPKVEPKKPEPKPEPKKPEPKVNSDLLKKLRDEEIARATGGLPATGSSSAGNSRNKAQYSDKIRQYVRSRIVFPGASSVDGNPQAVFEVRQLPTGEIVSITQKQSSGIPAWDSAVERALQRSSPLPKADDGSVEPVLLLSFRPKDIQ